MRLKYIDCTLCAFLPLTTDRLVQKLEINKNTYFIFTDWMLIFNNQQDDAKKIG